MTELTAEVFWILKDDAVKVLHPVCQQIWKTQQWPQEWKRSVFILIPKKDNANKRSSHNSTVLTSHAFKIMLKILQEMGVLDHFICFLRNLYLGQEATVRTEHGTTDCFKIKKGIGQDCMLSPCLFNLYAEYIMRNARLEEPQVGIQIARRNINNIRYADDTTLMEEN